MFNIGPVELIVLLAIGLVFLGPEKFPEVVKLIMRAYRDLRGYVNDLKRDISDEINPVKTELRQLSKFNPEDYVEKLTSAIMKDDEAEAKKTDAAIQTEPTATGANGSVVYQAHEDHPKTEEASKVEAHKEEEYPD